MLSKVNINKLNQYNLRRIIINNVLINKFSTVTSGDDSTINANIQAGHKKLLRVCKMESFLKQKLATIVVLTGTYKIFGNIPIDWDSPFIDAEWGNAILSDICLTPIQLGLAYFVLGPRLYKREVHRRIVKQEEDALYARKLQESQDKEDAAVHTVAFAYFLGENGKEEWFNYLTRNLPEKVDKESLKQEWFNLFDLNDDKGNFMNKRLGAELYKSNDLTSDEVIQRINRDIKAADIKVASLDNLVKEAEAAYQFASIDPPKLRNFYTKIMNYEKQE